MENTEQGKILVNRVFDACLLALKENPKLELETIEELRKVDKILRHHNIAYISRALNYLKEIGILNIDSNMRYSLNQ